MLTTQPYLHTDNSTDFRYSHRQQYWF